MTQIRIWWKTLQFLEHRPDGETISSLVQNVFAASIPAWEVGEVLEDLVRAGIVEKSAGVARCGPSGTREFTLYRVTEYGRTQVPRRQGPEGSESWKQGYFGKIHPKVKVR